jgi:hypothetical protein
VELLEKAKASLQQIEGPKVQFSGVDDPYASAIRQLTGNLTTPLENQVADLLATLRDRRSKLQIESHSSQ